MTNLHPALAALDTCDKTLDKLDKLCCNPGRSPRMAKLAETVADARRGLDDVDADQTLAANVLAHLEDAGAQIGSLQVGCCAPARMPLYATFLENLTQAQLSLKQNAC